MTTEHRLQAFVSLGQEIRDALQSGSHENAPIRQKQLWELSQNLYLSNPWFSPDQVQFALEGIAEMLQENALRSWISAYSFPDAAPKTIGVIMAGNIPAVGFHDFLCVLLSGHAITAKLSSDDRLLIPALAAMLVAIEPEFAQRIHFTEGKMLEFSAIIATGSNNAARYFEYYFGKYPHIIRKSRTSLAILDGNETRDDLQALMRDVFGFYGMGCRSVTHVFMPPSFEAIRLLEESGAWNHLQHHSKYFHNYEYHRAGLLVNRIAHYDNGYLILKEDEAWHSPVAMLHFSRYQNTAALRSLLLERREEWQVICAREPEQWPDAVAFGHTQKPGPADYADGIDTLKFLGNL